MYTETLSPTFVVGRPVICSGTFHPLVCVGIAVLSWWGDANRKIATDMCRATRCHLFRIWAGSPLLHFFSVRFPCPARGAGAMGKSVSETSFGCSGTTKHVIGIAKAKGGRSSSDGCLLCRRKWSSANPLKNHKLKTLPRVAASGPALCIICAAVLRRTGEKRESKQKEMDDDSNKLDAWMDICHKYEAKRNGEHVEDLPDSASGSLQTISRLNEEHVVSKSVLPIVWPEWIWLSFYGTPIPEEELANGYDMNGVACRGKYISPDRDAVRLPSGVAQSEKRRVVGIRKDKQTDRSDDHIVEGQGEVAWNRAQASMHIDLRHDPNKPENAPVIVARDAASDDSDDDGFALVSHIGTSASSASQAPSSNKRPRVSLTSPQQTPRGSLLVMLQRHCLTCQYASPAHLHTR